MGDIDSEIEELQEKLRELKSKRSQKNRERFPPKVYWVTRTENDSMFLIELSRMFVSRISNKCQYRPARDFSQFSAQPTFTEKEALESSTASGAWLKLSRELNTLHKKTLDRIEEEKKECLRYEFMAHKAMMNAKDARSGVDIQETNGTWSYRIFEKGIEIANGSDYPTEDAAIEAAEEQVDNTPDCMTCGDQGHIPQTPYDCPDCQPKSEPDESEFEPKVKKLCKECHCMPCLCLPF